MSQKTPPHRMNDEARRDIELMLWGAVAIKQPVDELMAKVPVSLLSAPVAKLFSELETTQKKKSLSPDLKEWFDARAVVLERGDDLLSAIIRRLSKEKECRYLEANVFSVTSAMKYGDRDRVVELLKRMLVELGELEVDKNG